MDKQMHTQKDTRNLKVFAVVFVALNILLWYSVLAYQAPVRASDAMAEKIAFSNNEALQNKPALELHTPVEKKIGRPERIKIPSISVDTEVEHVGQTKTGSMDTPKQPLNTGWYELGPRPGETGSAVIDGHLDWKDGTADIFADLDKVTIGDTIEIQDEHGTIIPFIVQDIKMYLATADTTNIFNSTDGKAHLNLITCSGAWNKKNGQYDLRLVVFADKKTE